MPCEPRVIGVVERRVEVEAADQVSAVRGGRRVRIALQEMPDIVPYGSMAHRRDEELPFVPKCVRSHCAHTVSINCFHTCNNAVTARSIRSCAYRSNVNKQATLRILFDLMSKVFLQQIFDLMTKVFLQQLIVASEVAPIVGALDDLISDRLVVHSNIEWE